MAKLIDVICDEFEKSWRNGESPRIETFLERCPDADQLWLLKELLGLEIELRGESESGMDPAGYLARFPQAEQVVHDVLQRTSTVMGYLTTSYLPLLFQHGHPESGESFSAPLEEVKRLATESVYAPGKSLVRQGDEATSLMIIREGIVEIRVTDDDGMMHVIGRLGPGQVLGEMALLTSEPRTASAIAIERVRASVLPVDLFHELCERHPQLSILLTELIAERLGNDQQDALTCKQLDRYRIRRRLGRGGMSVVYEAIDTEVDSRVALKMMSHRLVCSHAALQRFQLEADMIEHLNHPHIVKMYGRFSAFRTYFIVMEYCDGETLSEYIDRTGAMDDISFCQAFGQLVSALTHAHKAGIVHRDIKPSNIMILPGGTLKLMDFGLAEPLDVGASGEGGIAGTPNYMAPEQRRGEIVDERADYFSLGCVAYEMLTGSTLFTQSTRYELSRDFRMWQPPDFTSVSASLTSEMFESLQCLLAPDPANRKVDLSGVFSSNRRM